MKRKANSILNRTLIMLGSIAIVFILLYQSFFYGVYSYEIGQYAKENIYLPRDIVDTFETEAQKKRIESEITPVVYVDFSKIVESKKSLTDFFARAYEIKTTYGNDIELMRRVYAGIEKNNRYHLSDDQLMGLVVLSVDKLKVIETYAVDITSQNMSAGVSSQSRPEVLANIHAFIATLTDINDFEKELLTHFVNEALVENQFIDQLKTESKIEQEVLKLNDIVLLKGSLLVPEGALITERIHTIMFEAGMLAQSQRENLWIAFGLFILMLILWGLMHYYLYLYEKALLSSTKQYAILMSLFIFTFVLSRFFYSISPYFIPIPAFTMLASILLSPIVALYFSILLLIAVYLWTGMPLALFIAYILVILFLSILSKNVRQRSQIMTDSFASVAILILFTIAHAMVYKTGYQNLPTYIAFSLGNGLFSAVLTIGIMPLFESIFGTLTPFKLLELSNPNRPLLKRLLLEAPGTYHHSILVGNLAEAAAHDIGANGLLTRVAAFYHDVGKLDKPYYFKENQLGKDNPHDHLPPVMSASIIKSHMTIGVELCEKSKLPKEVIDVIKAHHGTSLIKYFYHQELQVNPQVDVSKFVYDGPKPESKEAVILMLADSVEAAVRTLESRTPDALKDLIDKIFNQKIAENQMTSSIITLRELETIKHSFTTVLSGIFHERIAYPEVNVQDIDKDNFKEKEGKS